MVIILNRLKDMVGRRYKGVQKLLGSTGMVTSIKADTTIYTADNTVITADHS